MRRITVRRGLPRLEFGDRLTRDEFERRYAAMPHLHKAELIDGMVYLQPEADDADHVGPRTNLGMWLSLFAQYTDGVETIENRSIRIDPFSMPQPDALMRILPSHGGQTSTADNGIIDGPPELIGEIASSRASYDLHDKLEVYRRNGVAEYCVWAVLEQELLWFRLASGRYQLLKPGPDGVHRSQTFPGLWLDAEALLEGHMARVIKVARQGLGTLDHASFVLSLETTADRRRK
ncbi:MAG TPA: Uma2 family endonuclease [Planctomycetaceae bacterium]|nr:Uma2 family endonuclease [Planctomycetaceae bacterium]